jgi:hypothetical protein
MAMPKLGRIDAGRLLSFLLVVRNGRPRHPVAAGTGRTAACRTQLIGLPRNKAITFNDLVGRPANRVHRAVGPMFPTPMRSRGPSCPQSALPLRCYHACCLGAEAPLATERVERRLTAILVADVAGYSRFMGADEEGTLAQLKAHRRALVDPKITEQGGRIVKTTGDGMLVAFASVVDALRCAIEVQRGMAREYWRKS